MGAVVAGHRVGWDLQLTQYGDGNWRATFYVTGAAHSIVGGSAWKPTPLASGAAGGVGGTTTLRARVQVIIVAAAS
jgi:hypothetical protein